MVKRHVQWSARGGDDYHSTGDGVGRERDAVCDNAVSELAVFPDRHLVPQDGACQDSRRVDPSTVPGR